MASSDGEGRDRVLRAGSLAGDADAWRTLVEECFEPLYRYVRWRCARRVDWTDEIVQETWLSAVRSLRRYDPRQGSFLGWLRGIAANVLRNDLRRRQAEWARLVQRDASPDEAVAAERSDAEQERGLRVAASLDQLPDHYEAVLRAKYLDGRSVADIAAASGQSPKAVESLLTRAREAFRVAFEAQAESDLGSQGAPSPSSRGNAPAAGARSRPSRTPHALRPP